MLNFLRKHQRIFFIIITTVIVISFSFFGTFSTLARSESLPPDREVIKSVTGTPIMQRELQGLCRLISSSPFDRAGWKRGELPNLLNNGVVERDFLANGMAMMVARRYFDQLKPDLDQRAKKIQSFRPYHHPHAEQISAEGVWQQFSPSLLTHLKAMKTKSDQATNETLALMCQLYLDQAMLPPEMLKQILIYQQNQRGIEPDSLLVHRDLSLFGFKSLEDWFGPHFVELIGQFLFNAAAIAEEKGYTISAQEVRSDLFQNIYSGYREFSRESDLTPEDAELYYQREMKQLGFDEATTLQLWRKVMLFRRLLSDAGGSVMVDSLAHQQFLQFSKESVQIELYELPRAFQLADFSSMLKLQIYLEAIAQDAARQRNALQLPRAFATLVQIEKRHPGLVEREVEIEWSEVKSDELLKEISLKATWEWENEASHWELLKSHCPELASFSAQNNEERSSALDRLEAAVRLRVDQFARSKILEEHSEWSQNALDRAPVKKSVVGLRTHSMKWPFSGQIDSSALVSLLEKAPLKGETEGRVNYCTRDRGAYYRIHVLRRDADKKVLTFESAMRDGTLDALLEQCLTESCPEIKKKDLTQDQAGKRVFAELLKAIEDNVCSQGGSLPKELPLQFYSDHRLACLMQEAKQQLEKGEALSSMHPLSDQWSPVRSEQKVERGSKLPFSKEGMFTSVHNRWSSVQAGKGGALAFYRVLEKLPPESSFVDALDKGHEIISMDAQRDVMLQLLKSIEEKKSIDLSLSLTEAKA